MIKYLFSNIDKINGFNELQSKDLSKDLKKCNSILFIPGDYDSKKYNLYKNKIVKWFRNIGINFKENYLASLDDELKTYDVIFLMGGNPVNQMDIINKIKLKTIINAAKIVIGVSAGAINLSKEVIYYNNYSEKLEIYDGIGLININVYPHFDIKHKDFEKEVKMVSMTKTLIALPNETFIKFDDEQMKFWGEYYKVENGNIIKIN